jgi:hypothetical protein
MDKLKIKAEVEEYIKIQIPPVPRKNIKYRDTNAKSPQIVHKESKVILVSHIEK